ncbi:MAG: hypothetical protein LBU06_09890 [Desulfovibrio sp.]|nr:hypothetical protein [Desulfovibrio sp.]
MSPLRSSSGPSATRRWPSGLCGGLLRAAALSLLLVQLAAVPSFAAAQAGLPAADPLAEVEPVLTIFYNASSFGEMHPCPTCGKTPDTYGGMARRAGLFREYRRLGKPCLVIAGPYEFLADDPTRFGHLAEEGRKNSFPSAEEASLALKVHELLRVDTGWISGKAARWLRGETGRIPPGYLVSEGKSVSRLLNTRAGSVGVVFFPEGPVPGKGPGPGQESEVLAAGKALREKAALLVGVSPWGAAAEKKFLPKAQGVFDCILGGGEGIGFDFIFAEGSSSPIWIRPDVKGRAVNVLEIYLPPLAGSSFVWSEGKTYNAWLDFMGEGVPVHRAALELIGPRREK